MRPDSPLFSALARRRQHAAATQAALAARGGLLPAPPAHLNLQPVTKQQQFGAAPQAPNRQGLLPNALWQTHPNRAG